MLHPQLDPSLQQMHSTHHFDKFYNYPDALRAIFIPTQTQLARLSCCVATTLHRPRRYISFESIWLTPSKTISTTWLDTQYFTRLPRVSPLGHAARRHSAVPHITTRLCTSSPLSPPARRHLVVHIIAHRPPGASPSVGHVFTSTPPTRERLSYSYDQTSYHTL